MVMRAPTDVVQAVLQVPTIASAVGLALSLDAPAAIIRISPDGPPIIETVDREVIADEITRAGLVMPPPGGLVVVVRDASGVLGCARLRHVHLAPGGAT